MRKFLLTLIVCLCTLCVYADTWESAVTYRTSKAFDTATVSLQKRLSLTLDAGLRAKYSKERLFKDPIYAVYMPVEWNSELTGISITPFYYSKSKTKQDFRDELGRQDTDSYAYGISSRLVMTLQQDTVNDLYTHAYVGASFARQQGILALKDGSADNQYYSQMAYTLGLHKNFFRSFSFEALGAAFQYPDGISKVAGLCSVLDQQDLAPLQSFDITHNLPKYTAGARLTRLWTDRQATLYLGYRFGEFYTADPEHSFIIGNTFALTQTIGADIAYNHLRTVHNKDKRDILHAQIHMNF